jgi:hypothetical protein
LGEHEVGGDGALSRELCGSLLYFDGSAEGGMRSARRDGCAPHGQKKVYARQNEILREKNAELFGCSNESAYFCIVFERAS